jgi:hypothetical protein
MPTTYPDPVNPLLPSVDGTELTVDFMLNNPTVVTAIVADLTMRNFFLDRIFSSGGEVEGGAVLYDQANFLDTYLDRDVERIAPGAEAPIVGGSRTAPLMAQVEKFGGKFPTVDEARRRNRQTSYNNNLRRLANTIVRKMNQRGMAELAAAITAYSRTGSGVSWGDAMTLTMTTRTAALMPMRDVSAAQKALENLEMDYEYDTLVVNPQESDVLRVLYEGELDEVLADNGINELVSTPRQAAGKALLCAGGQVGELRLEEPLRTWTADEKTSAPTMVEQTWTQSMVNPIMYVTDPYAIVEITGLDA